MTPPSRRHDGRSRSRSRPRRVQMAGHRPALAQVGQRRVVAAAALESQRAAGVEAATRRRPQRAGHLTLHDDALAGFFDRRVGHRPNFALTPQVVARVGSKSPGASLGRPQSQRQSSVRTPQTGEGVDGGPTFSINQAVLVSRRYSLPLSCATALALRQLQINHCG